MLSGCSQAIVDIRGAKLGTRCGCLGLSNRFDRGADFVHRTPTRSLYLVLEKLDLKQLYRVKVSLISPFGIENLVKRLVVLPG